MKEKKDNITKTLHTTSSCNSANALFPFSGSREYKRFVFNDFFQISRQVDIKTSLRIIIHCFSIFLETFCLIIPLLIDVTNGGKYEIFYGNCKIRTCRKKQILSSCRLLRNLLNQELLLQRKRLYQASVRQNMIQ